MSEPAVRGLDLCRDFFNAYGLPMLREKFPDLLGSLACGVCGPGSECFGFDDALSRDHDFEPGFYVFVPDSLDDRKLLFELEREYSRLPKEFGGVRRTPLKPVGGARSGVVRTGDFFAARVGVPDGDLPLEGWLTLPEYALAEAINGEIFFDGSGAVTAVRRRLERYPEPVRLKKLAGRLLLASQSGQYNYRRCLGHGEPAAAQLALFEFARSVLHAVFLLNGRYMPFYKWCFRAARDLPKLPSLAETLEFLITADNSPNMAEIKSEAVENVCALLAAEVEAQNIAPADPELERLAYAVNDAVDDVSVRALNIFAGV